MVNCRITAEQGFRRHEVEFVVVVVFGGRSHQDEIANHC